MTDSKFLTPEEVADRYRGGSPSVRFEIGARCGSAPRIDDKDIDRLKREPGGDIVIYGSLSVIDALSNLNLIDQYQLLLHPIVLGKGKPLLDKGEPMKMELEIGRAVQIRSHSGQIRRYRNAVPFALA